MTKAQFSKKIIIAELIGFILVITILWLDELLDLPHMFLGAPATPINLVESIFETIITLLLAALVTFSTHTLLKRIRYLEGILPVCSFCKKIRADNRWVPIDSYIRDHSEADFSHSICPQCAAEHYGDVLDSKEAKREKYYGDKKVG
ncbi:MAG: hypothetical protein KKI12_01650 [Proteobacteria bacterium]|nr:hypothetical protein [Pseudomonadota bacterium]MBU4286859.1 hypothetical protein [Pseudomonadota bacterium]MCG2758439.1 hypothetical protein [Desulfobacteraceae bacterium]